MNLPGRPSQQPLRPIPRVVANRQHRRHGLGAVDEPFFRSIPSVLRALPTGEEAAMSAAAVQCLCRGNATITVHVRGTGPLVALVPSLGRAASDFDELAGRLVGAGYTTAAIDPRGLDGEGVRELLTLHDLAEDTAFAIKSLALGPAHLV